MDEETLTTLIKEQARDLPPSLQRAVSSPAVRDYVEEFARARNLTIEQMNTLENEFTLILLGIERLDDLRDNLLEHTDLDEYLVDQVYTLVFENVIAPVEEELRSLYRRQDAAEELATAGDANAAQSTEELDRDAILRDIEEPEHSRPRGDDYQSNETTMSQLSEDKNHPSDEPTEAEEQAARDLTKEAAERGYEGGDDPYREPPE